MSIGSFEVHQDLFKRWLALQSATHTHWHLQRSWLCKWMRCTFALKLRKLNRRFIACAFNSSTSENLTTLFAASTIYNIPRSCTWCVYIYIFKLWCTAITSVWTWKTCTLHSTWRLHPAGRCSQCLPPIAHSSIQVYLGQCMVWVARMPQPTLFATSLS